MNTNLKDDYVDIVFEGSPGHNAPKFMEIENSKGASIHLGTWIARDNGNWVIRITKSDFQKALP